MRTSFPGISLGQAANFKIILLVIALACVLGLLFYSQRITDDLLSHERQVLDLYARSLEYAASDRAPGGDFSFIFEEIIRTIDFPVILTDPQDKPIYARNLQYDTTLAGPAREAFFRVVIA